MTQISKTTVHPNNDERYTAIDRTMKRFNSQKDALLEVLNSAQESFGYLSEELLEYIAQQLNVPYARVYGVATFYHMFTFEPLGEHNCIVCAGTACYVKGAERIAAYLANEFEIQPGSTTSDGLFSLKLARCLGSCGLAPVVILDGVVRGKETPEAITTRVKELVARSKELLQENE